MTAARPGARLRLDHLVQEEMAWSPSPNPRAIADRIAGHVPDEDLRRLLGDALVYAVRKIAGRNRSRLAGLHVVNGRSQADPAAVVDQIMAAGPGRWKRFGAFTRADLADQVRHRLEVARAQAAELAQIERLIDALEEAGVGRPRRRAGPGYEGGHLHLTRRQQGRPLLTPPPGFRPVPPIVSVGA